MNDWVSPSRIMTASLSVLYLGAFIFGVFTWRSQRRYYTRFIVVAFLPGLLAWCVFFAASSIVQPFRFFAGVEWVWSNRLAHTPGLAAVYVMFGLMRAYAKARSELEAYEARETLL